MLEKELRELGTESRGGVIPVHESNDGGLVVDIVEVQVRVVGIINDHRSTKTVTILRGQVTVVPESAGLARSREVVEEGVACRDRALAHHGWTISPVGALLEKTMPVLQVKIEIKLDDA